MNQNLKMILKKWKVPRNAFFMNRLWFFCLQFFWKAVGLVGETMSWSIPEDITREIENLDAEKKEKVLRYILRENEVGRFPARDELLEIIHYLKGKTEKDIRKSGKIIGFKGENVSLENEKKPLDYIKIFNCTYCRFSKNSTCDNEDSVLFKRQIDRSVICAFYEENI